jgi:signal transduction histidine kinase
MEKYILIKKYLGAKRADIRMDWGVWIIPLLIIVISILHYTTTTKLHHIHEIYRRLYYIPIIIAAFRFSFWGGIFSSFFISLIYVPHIIFQWEGVFLDNLVRFTEIILYLAVGCVAGILSKKVQKERDRYKSTAEELEKSYKQLEFQSGQLSEMENQLRAADRLAVLGELSASLAHEVRNPLGSIKGAADILNKRSSTDKTTQEFTNVLTKEVNRLNQVVENYLGLAHTSSDHIDKSDLKSEIQLVLDLAGPEIRKKQIQVRYDFPDHPVFIRMQKVEIRQVLLNLVLNALTALNEKGHLHIRVEPQKNKIIVAVTDTGIGIPHDQISAVFRPFFTTRKSGTGLGLSIVKRIMETHGGEIKVESSQGKETTFFLTFIRTNT